MNADGWYRPEGYGGCRNCMFRGEGLPMCRRAAEAKASIPVCPFWQRRKQPAMDLSRDKNAEEMKWSPLEMGAAKQAHGA